MTFQALNLVEPLTRALETEGYTSPTPIQTQAIPHVLAGRDLIACAQTGTGKTAAFALPILQRLDAMRAAGAPKGIRALILTPTRELAAQITESLATYGKNLRLRHAVVFGGVGAYGQVRALETRPDILVATPGRLLDLASEGFVDLRALEIFVLDEPVRVAVVPVATTADRIDQSVYFVPREGKRALLEHVLKDQAIERALVFTRTKHGADKVVKMLERASIFAEAIHGNKSQNARTRALLAFREGRTRVLVATDIAARGIDVDGVSHVINFDLPDVAESYVHRIGRTARAGASGIALSFCDSEERSLLTGIERLIRMRIPVAASPAGIAASAPAPAESTSTTPVRQDGPSRWGGGGGGGGNSRRRGGPNRSRGNRF